MSRAALPVLSVLLLSACATSGLQTRDVLHSPPPGIARHARLDQVPFVAQVEEGYCGPSSLAMVMRSAGREIPVDTLAQEVYTVERKGSLQAHLVGAARRHGLLAVQIDGLASLLTEVAAGHPVMVFENLGFSWWPRWHYSVVVGYDLDEQEVLRHSGDQAFTRQSLNHFERGWKLGEYWGLVVLPPAGLAASAGELSHLKGAVGLEQTGHVRESEHVYRNVLKKWPGSLAALIGLGNLAYQRGDHEAAVAYLRQAVKTHPGAEAARHNLAVAEASAREHAPRRVDF